MEEEEDIKKIIDNNVNYDEFSINELINELKILKKKMRFLENLLKKKK